MFCSGRANARPSRRRTVRDCSHNRTPILVGLDDIEEQIEVDRRLGFGSTLAADRGIRARRHALEVELDLNQRQTARITRQREFSHQAAVGVVLMFVAIEQHAANLFQKLLDFGIAIERSPQRQEIHAVADQRLVFQLRLPGRRNADDNVVWPTSGGQQNLEAGQQGDKQRAALLRRTA